MNRYLVCHKPIKIYNNEKLLPKVIFDLAPQITDCYCISPKYSALDQAMNLETLFLKLNLIPDETLLNRVDFGGDILTNGDQSSIISPGLDAYTLALVSNLYKYQSVLSVCFPGVDGELDVDYLTNTINSFSIEKTKIDNNLWTTNLIKIYDTLKDIRPGNTIPNMLNIMLKDINKIDVNKNWNVCGQKISFSKQMTINKDLQQYVFTFDTFKIASLNPFVSIFNRKQYDLKVVVDHILSIYKKQCVNNNYVQSSDFHLQYLRKDIFGNWSNKQLVISDAQEVMLVDILPSILRSDLAPLIKNSTAYDSLYTHILKNIV
jgi:hypothetical protein